jgi:hypothetical protein
MDEFDEESCGNSEGNLAGESRAASDSEAGIAARESLLDLADSTSVSGIGSSPPSSVMSTARRGSGRGAKRILRRWDGASIGGRE